RPQDGRTRLHVDDESIDARVFTLPTRHGEKIVIRLLSRSDDVPALARSGFEEKQLETILNTMVVPEGLILITGPTGSGKTTTLYSAINQLRTAERNIVTLEDPIEIALTGINQVQVHERSGLTFARGLRSILRQDPDIVLVGEVRDTETAELALQASLTGHLVLTTLHTNDAASAITRLVDMGLEPFLVASSLSMVVAQRLVRTPCLTCAAPYMPSPRTLALLGLVEADVEGANLQRGRGCGDCGGTGYRGRTGIFEVLPVTAAIRAVLLSTPTEAAIEMAAHSSGMLTLRAHGLLKALRGETTLEEVLRVTHVDADAGTRCVACDRGLGEDMIACPWCATPVDRGHCMECRRQLDPAWRVCPYCRTPVATPTALEHVVGEATAHRPDRVLVVDDDLSICAYVAAALEGTCEVVATPDAETALRRCATEDFDGAIVDLVLPDLTGIELVRLLRGDPRTAVMPIVLMTGTDDRRTEAEALHAGADDYLMKPIDPDLLQERVSALLQRNKHAAPAGV
ncbi:MAG: Flp pilus assembly complex ATPase component TadA, partial [Frankia sp.]|nr:Flp pilus assembly complex ATPase component TadA [Frankia sp.]